MFRRINLSLKLSLIYISLLTLIVAGSGTFSYLKAKSIVQQQINNDIINTMNESVKNINTILDNINKVSVNMFFETSIVELLTGTDNDALLRINNISRIDSHITRYFDMLIGNSLSQYAAVFFFNSILPVSQALNSGNLPVAFGGTSVIYNDTDVINELWYKKTDELDGTPYWFFDNSVKDRLYITRLVKNPVVNQPQFPTEKIGVIAIGLDVKQLKDSINTSSLTSSTVLILSDGNGEILYSSDVKMIRKNIESYYSGIQNVTGTTNNSSLVTYNTRQYILCMNSLKWDWKLIALIPTDDISNRVNIIIRVIILSIFFAVIIGILISIFVSNRISQPIKKLAGTMKSIKSKNSIGISLVPPSQDEVGVLYESFNEMMIRIDSLVDEVYKSTMLQKVSELKALQAQINPHFLYNTLDSVCWLALRDGNDRIVDMLSALAAIMRYSIKDGESIVTLSDEIENIRNYSNIMKSSHVNSFEICYDISPVLNKYRIPKFIVQPLVENAIIHGIPKNDIKGEILISGYMEDDFVYIKILDNGHCDRIEELNLYLDGRQTSLKDSDGFGIKNVNQRIKMHFGEKYGLKYSEDSMGRTVASLTLPGN